MIRSGTVTKTRLAPARRSAPASQESQISRLARAYDLAGNTDSTVAVLARYVEHPARDAATDGYFLTGAHKRLGELYDARGDRAKAISHYSRFVELWKNADAELQPLVRSARDRLATLQRAER